MNIGYVELVGGRTGTGRFTEQSEQLSNTPKTVKTTQRVGQTVTHHDTEYVVVGRLGDGTELLRLKSSFRGE